jgi:putative ABC transport system permease protein
MRSVAFQLAVTALFLIAAPAPAQTSGAPRTITVDARLARVAGVTVGDTVELSAAPGERGAPAIIAAIVQRAADPAQVARAEYHARLHLTHLQTLVGYGDRVDRFAVDVPPEHIAGVVNDVNALALGFRAHRSAEIAVETSRTFQVVRRFNRAIGVVTISASAIFLLCIMLLRVEERRREVATLRVIGISRRTVVRAIVLEASLIATLGSIAGIAFGYAASALVNAHYRRVYETQLAFSLVTPGTVMFAVLLSIVLGVAAGLLAAVRLVRRQPLSLLGR